MRNFLLIVFLGLGCFGSCFASDIHFVSSLKAGVNKNLQRVLDNPIYRNSEDTVTFNSLDRFVAISESLLDYKNPDEQFIVALGPTSCDSLASLEIYSSYPIICSAITHNQFKLIDKNIAESFIHTVYLDQPAKRQIAVAHHFFSSLKRFGVLATEQFHLQSAVDQSNGVDLAKDLTIVPFTFVANRRLPPQIKLTKSSIDALVAVADPEVYNSNNFSPILLTSYGLGIPLIGYSTSMQNSGALISIYSSLEQILFTIREFIGSYSKAEKEGEATFDKSSPEYSYCKYYHVDINSSVASSLDLREVNSFDRERWYKDGDFLP